MPHYANLIVASGKGTPSVASVDHTKAKYSFHTTSFCLADGAQPRNTVGTEE